MKRAYVRDQDGETSRQWTPIGWYCKFCATLWPEAEVAGELSRER